MLYFLSDAVHYPDPQAGLLILMSVYGVALIVAALLTGTYSDRSAVRKPYVVVSAMVMALAALLLAIAPTWQAALVAAVLLGAGYGAYWAVALAILTQVLPRASDRAKDLGVVNIANTLPQVVAPLLAGGVLGLWHNYSVLFGLAVLATLAGGLAVRRIRSLR